MGRAPASDRAGRATSSGKRARGRQRVAQLEALDDRRPRRATRLQGASEEREKAAQTCI